MAKKGGLSAGDVAALYKHKNAVVDVKVDTESNVASCLFSLSKFELRFLFFLIIVSFLSRSGQPSLSQISCQPQKLLLHLKYPITNLARYQFSC